MATIPPIVRHMIVCDGVARPGAGSPKLNVLGLVNSIVARPDQGFPLRHPLLCVYLMLSGGVGTGRVQIIVGETDTDTPLFGTPVHEVTYPADRHIAPILVVRLEDCVFPRPGLYWVEFHHDGIVLQREPVVVRRAMTDGQTPVSGTPSPQDPAANPGRPYWIDEHGNVHGVILTVDAPHVIEFTDKAITDPAELAKLRKPGA